MMVEISPGFSVRAENVSHIKIVQCSDSNWCYNHGKPQTTTQHWREVRLYILGKLEKKWMFSGSRKSEYDGEPANKKEEIKAVSQATDQYNKLIKLLENNNG